MAARRHRGTPSIVLSAVLGASAVVCALFVPLLGAAPTGAASSHDGACVGDTGVTVVVDATNLGAGVRVSCALGAQANGWEALKNAGHSVAPTPIAAGAVCQIDGFPTEGYPTCWETNFWSYHHAPNARAGAVWTFSSTGATTYKPAPGSVEGWKYTSTATQKDAPGVGPVFAAALPPTTPPPTAPPATSPPPAPPAGGTAKPGTGPSVATAPPVKASSGSAVGAPTTVPGAPAAGPPTTPPSPAVAGATDATGSTTTAPAASGSDDPEGRALGGVDLSSETHSSGGFPFAMLIGIALIVAFAASAGVVAFRRRNTP